MRQKYLLAGLVLGTIFLAGCGSSFDSVTENTMTIEKDGRIQDVSVEDFSDGDYNLNDLQEFIDTEIADYNAKAGEESVVLKQFDIENQVARVQISYTDMEHYNAFNHTSYELEALEDVKLSGSFTAADGSSVSAADISEANGQVLQVEDAMNIVCKGKVLYYNENVTETNGTYTASGEGTAVIVFK